MPDRDPVLEVRDLTVEYVTGPRRTSAAVDGVDLDVGRGEFVGVVGESGCGKSTLLFAIAQLLSPPAAITAGSVDVPAAQNLVTHDRQAADRRCAGGTMSVVMQSAMNALNPVMTDRRAVRGRDARRTASVPPRRSPRGRPRCSSWSASTRCTCSSYPHQLSGGMRQRAMIAMALLFTPDLVIMDEPTSALDVVAQRSLMVQIKELQRRLGFAVVFVTHDMSLVSHFSDRLLVMYAGQVVEIGADPDGLRPARRTRTAAGLLDAFPSIRGPRVPLTGIPGQPARPGPAAGRLPVPAALPGRGRRVRRDRAGAVPGRTARWSGACCTRRSDAGAWRHDRSELPPS